MSIILKNDHLVFNGKYGGVYHLCEKKGIFNENVYIKKENGETFYIYKLGYMVNDIYVLSRRLGSYSIIAYLRSGCIYSKKGWVFYMGWFRWEKFSTVYFAREQKTNLELKSAIAEKIVIYSRFYNIHGGYIKIKDLKNDYSVYYNFEDKQYLYHDSSKWVISPSLDSQYTYMESESTLDYSPELANWEKAGVIVKRYIDDTYHSTDSSGNDNCFNDTEFLPIDSSIGNSSFNDVKWVRGINLQPISSKMVLIHNVEPNDILQGSLGDCWLLCALACLAEFPDYFKSTIFKKNNKISENGKYELQLYDISKGKWIEVTIDDKIPCYKKEWFDIPRPLFAQPNENELYILLIEKAFAKLSGCYDKLTGGYPVLAWLVLTGCEDIYLWSRNNDIWDKKEIALDKCRKDPWNFQNMWLYSTNIKHENKFMFEIIKHYDKKCYVISGAICGDIMEKQRDDGLVERHAYSIIKVYDDDNFKLIELRNPWGTDHEWNGDWSDKSDKWKKHPKLKYKLEQRREGDGLFWMSWDDFSNIFDDIQVCATSMLTKDANLVTRPAIRRPAKNHNRRTLQEVLDLSGDQQDGGRSRSD